MQTLSQEQKAQIKAIRQVTKEVTASKEKARQYLKESGIADFIKKATKALKEESTHSNGKNA